MTEENTVQANTEGAEAKEIGVQANELLVKYFNKMTFEDLLTYKQKKQEEQSSIIRKIVECVERMIKDHTYGTTPTQLRNVLQMVKNKDIKKTPSKLTLAVPKLAYTEGRHKEDSTPRKLIKFIRELAWAVGQDAEQKNYNIDERYEAFEEIMNTIVAYHKLNSNSKN